MEIMAIDLLGFIGMGLRQWDHLESAEQEVILRKAAFRIADCISLYSEAGEVDCISKPQVKLSSLMAHVALDQLPVQVRLRYPFELPPVFVSLHSHIFDDAYGDPISFQIMVYSEEELVLLPTVWRAGLPLKYECNWEDPPKPLSGKRLLKSGKSNWGNRLPTALLEVEEKAVSWRLCVPYPLLLKSLEADLESHKRDLSIDEIASALKLSLDGEVVEDTRVSVRYLSLYEREGRITSKMNLIPPEDTLVEFSMRCSFISLPKEVSIEARIPIEVERIVADVLVFGKWREARVLERRQDFHELVYLAKLINGVE
jgi:hypothetical protein